MSKFSLFAALIAVSLVFSGCVEEETDSGGGGGGGEQTSSITSYALVDSHAFTVPKGTSADGETTFKFITTDAGAYKIALTGFKNGDGTNANADVELNLYSTADLSSRIRYTYYSSARQDAMLATNLAANTTYYVKVVNDSNLEAISAQLAITRTGDGSSAAPVTLQLGENNNSRVGANWGWSGGTNGAYSYYKFTTDEAGAYTITTDTYSAGQKLGLFLYKTANFASYTWNRSGYQNTTELSELTAVLEPNTTYYLLVENDTDNADVASYRLRIERVGEGSPTNPVALTVGTGHRGQIGHESGTAGDVYNYYKFNTSTAGNYTIKTDNYTASQKLEFYVYGDSGYSGTVCSLTAYYTTANVSELTCNLTGGRTYYLIIGNYTDSADMQFDLSISGP